MKHLYNFDNFSIRISENKIVGYDEISQIAFNAFFDMQSANAGAGLYYRKKGESIELVRRNGGEESVDVADLKEILFIDDTYLPPRSSDYGSKS